MVLTFKGGKVSPVLAMVADTGARIYVLLIIVLSAKIVVFNDGQGQVVFMAKVLVRLPKVSSVRTCRVLEGVRTIVPHFSVR